MHRFFVPPTAIDGPAAHLDERVAHQLRHVLRMRPGARIVALDNRGWEYEIELDKITSEDARGRVIERRPAEGEPDTLVTLYQCLLKKDNFEWVLQKGTEIGLSRFVPVISQRTVAADSDGLRKHKLPRWERIVTEAAEQSGRGLLPVIDPPLTLDEALAQTRADLVLIPWEGEHMRHLHDVLGAFRRGELGTLPSERAPEIALVIGPEGGFAEEEIALASAGRAVSVTLGPRILRAETAAIAAGVIVLCGMHEMG